MAAPIANSRGIVAACLGCGQKNRVPFERVGDSGQCGKCGADLPPLAAPIEVGSADQFDSLIDSARVPVLVDFWAAWCGPCRMIAPELIKVAQSGRGRLLVAKVNSEEVPELATRYSVSGIPLLILFRGGREVSRLPGARPASAIESFVWQQAAA